jgi:hypothetical protein
MTATELRKFLHRAPFVPFDIVLPGREKIPVRHPDFMSISPSGRIAKIWLNDEDEAAVDVFLITAVEGDSKNGKGKRPGRGERS